MPLSFSRSRHACVLFPAALIITVSACDPPEPDGDAGADTGIAAEDTVGQPVDDPGSGIDRTTSEATTLKRAFRAAYDSDTPVKRRTEDGRATVSPGMLVKTDFGPVLLSEVEVEDGCHACTGGLSASYLKPVDGRYSVTARYDDAIDGSSWGKPPNDWSVSTRYATNPVIFSTRGGTWQGYSCASGTLHELTPDGPRQIAAFPLFYDDSGSVFAGQKTRLEGRIANVRSRQSFDIVYTGSRKFTDHYVLRGTEYQREGKSQMEEC